MMEPLSVLRTKRGWKGRWGWRHIASADGRNIMGTAQSLESVVGESSRRRRKNCGTEEKIWIVREGLKGDNEH